MTQGNGRIPCRLFVLSGCVFTLGMSEFMIAGLLAPMSASLGRSEPTTALMVTAFAAAVVLSAPATSALTVLLRPKATLVGAMVTFVAAHLVTALVPVFWVMLVLRLVAGVACATFLSVGTVTGVRMVTPAMAPRAISIMVGGLTVSNVVGLPVAAWVGTALGWRAAFWLVAVLAAAACAVLVWTRIDPAPSTATGLRQQLVAEVRVLVRPTMLITFAIVIMFQAGMFATFTFLQPLTTIVGGVSPSATGGLLAVFGLGTLIGVALGGAVAHRGLLRNVTLSLVATSLTLILLMVLIRQPVLVIGAVVFGFGVSAFSISAALNGRVFALAGDAPTLASGMNISMLNLGNAIGPAVAGMVISANQSDYLLAPASSLGFITMALVGVAAIILTDRRHRTTADQDSLRQHS